MLARSGLSPLSIVLFLSLVCATLLLPSVIAGLSPIVVRGRHLIDSSTQRRFFVKGSGYDYDVSNQNSRHWRPAINALLNAAPHINTIRLYEGLSALTYSTILYHNSPHIRSLSTILSACSSRTVDPTLEYDGFMTAMSRRDIYVIVPLTPAKGWCTLNRDGTASLTAQPSCYPSCLLSHAQHTVNLFQPHSNVLAFTVGNEILNSVARWAAAGCVKSFTRDVKRFMRRCETEESSRRVPLLYAAADNAISGFTAEENDRLKSDYLTCGDDEDARIDVMGVNLFRYCSDTCTFHSCESNKVTAAFNTAPLPVLLTEYGCGDFTYHINHTQQAGVNPFTETAALYSPLMTGSFSGGCAYTYGVRGGESFAFFEGGGRSVSGEVGLVKRCGYPDGLCRVDAYEKQLAAAEEGERQREEARRKAKLTGEAEEELADNGAGDDEVAARTCPVLLGVELTIADSRQGADGYEEVACQAGVGKSATIEEERERQELDKEQQMAEKEQKKKLAERDGETGDAVDTESAQPAADPPQPDEQPEAGHHEQQQQDASLHHTNASKPVQDLRPPEHQAGAAAGGEQGAGEDVQPSDRSTADKQSAFVYWQVLALLFAVVAF